MRYQIIQTNKSVAVIDTEHPQYIAKREYYPSDGCVVRLWLGEYVKLPTPGEKRKWVVNAGNVLAANRLCEFLNARKRREAYE